MNLKVAMLMGIFGLVVFFCPSYATPPCSTNEWLCGDTCKPVIQGSFWKICGQRCIQRTELCLENNEEECSHPAAVEAFQDWRCGDGCRMYKARNVYIHCIGEDGGRVCLNKSSKIQNCQDWIDSTPTSTTASTPAITSTPATLITDQSLITILSVIIVVFILVAVISVYFKLHSSVAKPSSIYIDLNAVDTNTDSKDREALVREKNLN